MSETSEQRELPASAKKLRDARRKGQVAGGKDLIAAAGTVAAIGYVALRGPGLFGSMTRLLEDAGSLATRPAAAAVPAGVDHAARLMAGFVLPLVGLVVACVLAASLVAHGGLVVSATPLLPKMERLDPLAGFKRIVSLRNGLDGLKLLVRCVVVAVTAFLLLRTALRALTELPACGLSCVPGVAGALLLPLLVAAALLFLLLGGLDLGLQRFLFLREMRMTRTEQKRERKESEGNPLIKRAHKQEQRTMMGQGRTGLRQASFVVHGDGLALAFRYAPPDVLVPTLVARANGAAADTMLLDAAHEAIPIVRDDAAATVLAARVQLGGLLPRDAFAVAIACMRAAGVL